MEAVTSSKTTKDDGVLEYIIRARAGDKEARDTLVLENMGLVHMAVKQLKARGYSISNGCCVGNDEVLGNKKYERDDIVQIGVMGLIKAIDRFDVETGNAFSTYAVPMILGEIRRFMRDDRPVHVSRKIMEDAAKIVAATKNLDEPEHITVERLCELTGLKREDVIVAMDANLPINYLSQPIGEDCVLGDVVEDEKSGAIEVSRIENKILLNTLLDELKGEERKLIYLRYTKNMTQSQTAKLMDMNQVAVSRMEKKILETMRRKMP